MGWWNVIPKILRYIVMLGPLVYDAAKWTIKIVREFRKPKTVPPVEPEIPDTSPITKPDLDPG